MVSLSGAERRHQWEQDKRKAKIIWVQIGERKKQLLAEPEDMFKRLENRVQVLNAIKMKAAEQGRHLVDQVLLIFELFYKKYGYFEAGRNRQTLVWGSFFSTVEPLLVDDPEGKLQAQLAQIVKRVIESLYHSPKFTMQVANSNAPIH